MKRNVDLTENRDFSRPTLSNRRLKKKLIKHSNSDYPWSIKQSLNSFDENINEIVFTGNKRDRSRKKDWKLYNDLLSCERCGRNYSNTPWRMTGTLCIDCDQELSNDINNQQDLITRDLNRKN